MKNVVWFWNPKEPLHLAAQQKNQQVVCDTAALDTINLEQVTSIVLLADRHWGKIIQTHPSFKHFLLNTPTWGQAEAKSITVYSYYPRSIIKEKLRLFDAIASRPGIRFVQHPIPPQTILQSTPPKEKRLLEKLKHIFLTKYRSHDNLIDNLLDLTDELQRIQYDASSKLFEIWEERIYPHLELLQTSYHYLTQHQIKAPTWLLPYCSQFKQIQRIIVDTHNEITIIRKFNQNRSELLEGIRAIAPNTEKHVEVIIDHLITIRKSI